MTLVQGIFNEKCKIRNGDKQKIGRRGSGQTAIYYVECASCLFRGVAQPGSAPALGAGSRRFKSSRPDHHNWIVFIVCEYNHKMAVTTHYGCFLPSDTLWVSKFRQKNRSAPAIIYDLIQILPDSSSIFQRASDSGHLPAKRQELQ